jgi:SecD/SecF fusion protein
VEADFNTPQKASDIESKLSDLHDLVVNEIFAGDEERGYRFTINTSSPPGVRAEDYLDPVKQRLNEAFGDALKRNKVTLSNVALISAATLPAAKPAEPLAKPAAKTPEKPAAKTPAAEGHSGVLPAGRLDATALPALLLGQTDAAKKTASAEGQSKTAPSPASPLAKAVKTAAAKSEPAKPDTNTKAAPKTSGEQAAGTAEPQFLGGTQTVLEFTLGLNRDAVEAALRDAIKKTGVSKTQVEFLVQPGGISEAEFAERTSAAFEQWNVKIKLEPADAQKVFQTVKQDIESTPFFPSSATIGGAVAENTRDRALYALIAATICILVYLWIRFQRVSYGLGAVVSLVHDVAIAVGGIAASYYLAPFFGFLMVDQFKINITVTIAFLTLAGYSLNDTIVIFDRIREVRGKAPRVTEEMVNLSINQTLSRTLITSMISFVVIGILYVLGGPTIHGFAFAMLIGVVTGTYSSIYIASPFLLWISQPAERE